MFQQRNSTFTPIRSTVGKAVPFAISKRNFSIKAQELGITNTIEVKSRNSYVEAATDPDFLRFWPEIIIAGRTGGGITYSADTNQPQLIAPDPIRHPFPLDAQYWSIFALATVNESEISLSREIAISFDISLREPQLIGGIAFSGYPALGYTIDKFGRTSSNYGLPREMRISISSLQGQGREENQFIDSDLHYTNQVINYSSGMHFFHVEPTLTQKFTIQLSDFPLLMKKIVRDNRGNYKYAQAYGLVIPYLYVYTYKEKAHYHHHVPGGVVGTLKKNEQVRTEGLGQEYLSPEWQRLIEQEGKYQVFPASSIFQGVRKYSEVQLTHVAPPSREQFVSDQIRKGESISLICEQCDETLRSIAGLRLLVSVGDPQNRRSSEASLEKRVELPSREVNLIDKVGIRIYELDFPAGVSPLDAQQEELRKYKHLLAEKVITEDEFLDLDDPDVPLLAAQVPPDQRSIRFKRASNQRYFEIELTNLGNTTGNVVVTSAAFVQSAHITLHPKLSRRLQVARMHFRIVGSDLVEDYAQIGTHGFNFSIERLSGGQPIQQLIAIRSLADLMQSGMAKIMSNSRRRAIEFEKSNSYTYTEEDSPNKSPYADAFPEEANRPNHEVREVIADGYNFTRLQSGAGVPVPFLGEKLGESHSSQETRSHTEHLYPYTHNLLSNPTAPNNTGSIPIDDFSAPWEAAANYLNLGHGLFTDAVGTVRGWFIGDNSLLVPSNQADGRFINRLEHEFSAYWAGLEIPVVKGMKQVAMSPFSPVAIAQNSVKNAFEGCQTLFQSFDVSSSPDLFSTWNAVSDLIGSYQTLLPMFPGFAPAALPALAAYNAGNGLNIGVGVLFASTNSSLLTPSLTYNHSFGSQGTITKSASKTGYTKSETVRENKEQTTITTNINESENKRIVERRAVPHTDQKRIKGAEIMWQGELKDIILGTVSLDISFPAMAERSSIPLDEALRVRFGNGVGEDIEADFWFDISETEVRDDF